MNDSKGTVKRSARAPLVEVSRGKTKTRRVASDAVGDEDMSDGFDERVLMSMVLDIHDLQESVKRVKVQVYTLAKAKGVRVPKKIT